MTSGVLLRDVTLRDGLQIEEPVPLAGKRRLLEAVIATGVSRVEVTSFVSSRAVPALADAEAVAEMLSDWPDVEFSALVAGVRGARRALAAGLTRLEYVISASEPHSEANVGRSVSESLALTEPIAALVHDAGGSLEVVVAIAFDCPFGGRTSPDRVIDLATQAIALGADTICVGDTIGTATPGRVIALFQGLQDAAPGTELSAHFHDTRGAGVAAAWAAHEAGIRRFDGSAGGLGGCPFAPGASGNVAIEELVYLFEDSGIPTGVDLDLSVAAARTAVDVVGHALPSSLLKL